MGEIEYLDPHPTVIHCNVNIIHPQLRDLLQPAGEKGKVLFVNRLRIDCADFTTKKIPTALCTLDFTAVCLTTGAGLVAAGGQQSELDIRPLLPLPNSSSNESNAEAGPSTRASATHSSNHLSTNDQSSTSRHFPRWHLRTPTGGSINNSICIQSDLNLSPSSTSLLPGVSMMGGAAALVDEKNNCRHREKRRKELEGEMGEEDQETDVIWTRDGPYGRVGSDSASGRSKAPHDDCCRIGLESIVERNKIGMLASDEEKLLQMEKRAQSQKGQVFRNGLTTASATHSLGVGSSVRVLVSNNDQSVKEFRLRPPMKWRSAASTSTGNTTTAPATSTSSAAGSGGSGGERIESGLPGLSRIQTVEFPTCINHSSFSPDGRHLVSVGDTPEVFLYNVDPVSGDLTKIATYTASSDASFSTTWSPDGMRFAVASQDGYVSIWDVRSARKIASLQTSQHSDPRGSGAARVVKWSPRGDLLAFSEHTNYIHVVETTNFTTSQRLKVPVGGSVHQGRNAAAVPNHHHRHRLHPEPASFANAEVEINGTSSVLHDYDVEGSLHSSTDSTDSPSNTTASTTTTTATSILESTSPSRFVTSGRSSAASIAANNIRPWTSARRYRDIGNTANSRSPLDRALLGDWSDSRRGASHPEVYIDDSGPPSRHGGSRSSQLAPTNSSTTALARTVDDIMANLEDETTTAAAAAANQRGTGIWSLGELTRRIHRSENSIDISGLTWDPDGDYLYVSTEDLIAQYSVVDLRRSFGKAALR